MAYVPLENYPEDYQVLVCDLFQADVEFVWVEEGRVADHFMELEEIAHDWTFSDRAKCQDYLAAYRRGAKFPPLIANIPTGLLQDGYHRLWVYREVGVETEEFIYTERSRAFRARQS